MRAAGIPGVERVFSDRRAGALWLVCTTTADTVAVLATARRVAGEVEVEVVRRPAGKGRTRVRLEAATCAAVNERTRRAEVRLEWQGAHFAAEVTGPPGAGMETRLVAEATLGALRRVQAEAGDVHLVGVKPLRAFDADLMVASLYRSGPPPRRFVGAVVVEEDDAHRAVAAAVLSALNRFLGTCLGASP